MKFTDRYIKVPTKIYNKAEKELTGKEVCEDSYSKINPFAIEEYRPSFDNDFPDSECVHLLLKSGHEFLVYMTMEKFEAMLNNFNPETE